MGANEKYEAAMHGRLSTPSMDIMRLFYKIGRRSRLPDVSIDSMNAEFDRFIDWVRADAKAEALNEAASEIDRLDSDVEMYDENLNATQVTFWLRNRANQYKEES